HDSKQLMLELVEKYRSRLDHDLNMDYKIRRGKVHMEIETLSKSVGAAMVIKGAHTVNAYEEPYRGNNLHKIITFTGCPIITVRNDFELKDSIDTILVPIDTSGETIQKLPVIARIAGLFGSTVHVVATHYSHLASLQRVTEKNVEKALTYFISHKIKVISEKIVSNDITRAVIAHASNIQADLIVIMSEEETPANIMLGPHAQQLINHSPVPVLSVHPGEKMEI
ncbi:MAG: universal stress protein, partial [Syntrophothermus sp.]